MKPDFRYIQHRQKKTISAFLETGALHLYQFNTQIKIQGNLTKPKIS